MQAVSHGGSQFHAEADFRAKHGNFWGNLCNQTERTTSESAPQAIFFGQILTSYSEPPRGVGGCVRDLGETTFITHFLNEGRPMDYPPYGLFPLRFRQILKPAVGDFFWYCFYFPLVFVQSITRGE